MRDKIVLTVVLLMLTACAYAQVGWRREIGRAAIPQQAASGRIEGVPFRMDYAELKNGTLLLRQGKETFADRQILVFTFVNDSRSLQNKTMIIHRVMRFGQSVPHIQLGYRHPGSKNPPNAQTFARDYSMRLHFGRIQSGNIIPGEIYVCLPDQDRSYVVGTFQAHLK